MDDHIEAMEDDRRIEKPILRIGSHIPSKSNPKDVKRVRIALMRDMNSVYKEGRKIASKTHLNIRTTRLPPLSTPNGNISVLPRPSERTYTVATAIPPAIIPADSKIRVSSGGNISIIPGPSQRFHDISIAAPRTLPANAIKDFNLGDLIMFEAEDDSRRLADRILLYECHVPQIIIRKYMEIGYPLKRGRTFETQPKIKTLQSGAMDTILKSVRNREDLKKLKLPRMLEERLWNAYSPH